ncbi:hypothetical protein I4U23_019313 [Adineta vaga]|nr:hypothetical protein I4U23_019313 [Adineta vaga]
MTQDSIRFKDIVTAVNQLKNIGPTTDAPFKFAYEKSPLDGMNDDDDIPSPLETFTITGRIFPKSDIYKTGSLPIDIKVHPECPAKPPKVVFTATIFHPNVDKDGEICTDLLNPLSKTWKSNVSFNTIIEEVTKVVDEPLTDLVQHPEAASLWANDRAAYNDQATKYFLKASVPR